MSNAPNSSRFVFGIDDSTYRKLRDIEDIALLSYVWLVEIFDMIRLPTVSIRHTGIRYTRDLENIAQLGYAV